VGGGVELCVGAIVVDRGELLLVQRGRPPAVGQWSVPGGRVERGETMAAALVREVREETGLDVEPGPLVGWVERITADHHFVIFDFVATVTGRDGLTPGDDAAAARFVPLDGLGALPLVAGLVDFLADHGIAARRDG
jgi:ADP-ribose pyrophosphatase YjhB (NUDIX family)